jgi:hypothetical protein
MDKNEERRFPGGLRQRVINFNDKQIKNATKIKFFRHPILSHDGSFVQESYSQNITPLVIPKASPKGKTRAMQVLDNTD